MKTVFFGLALLCFAMGALALFVFPVAAKPVPAILVQVDGEASGAVQGLREENGYIATGEASGTCVDGKKFHVFAKYTVLSTTQGHFAVQGHYLINLNGKMKTVDRTIPVQEEQPEKATWSNLDGHLWTYAYRQGTMN